VEIVVVAGATADDDDGLCQPAVLMGVWYVVLLSCRLAPTTTPSAPCLVVLTAQLQPRWCTGSWVTGCTACLWTMGCCATRCADSGAQQLTPSGCVPLGAHLAWQRCQRFWSLRNMCGGYEVTQPRRLLHVPWVLWVWAV
jgi:hypothetical protein